MWCGDLNGWEHSFSTLSLAAEEDLVVTTMFFGSVYLSGFNNVPGKKELLLLEIVSYKNSFDAMSLQPDLRINQ